MIETVVTGGPIITMDARRRVLPSGHVIVRQSRIVAVGEGPPPPADEEIEIRQVVDSKGGVILPGFVQSHVHLCQSIMRNQADGLALLDWLKKRVWPLEGALDADAMRVSAQIGLVEMLRSGTTTILDMGSAHHYDAVFAAAEQAGIRMVGGKAMMDARGVPPSIKESTADALKTTEELIETWHGTHGGRLRYAVTPRFAISCTEKLLRACVEMARDKGLRLHTHASENKDEVAQVRKRTGMGNLEYLRELGLTGKDVGLAHCVQVDDADLKLLKETGTHVLHCPSSNLKLASGIAPVADMLKRKISVSLGADGAPCNNHLDPFTEMRLAALIHKVAGGPKALPGKQVVEMATLSGAKALGLQKEIGSLQPGKRADMIMVDLDGVHAGPGGDVYDQLVYAARPTDVRGVMIDGHMVVQEGALLTLDAGGVAREARDTLPKLLQRAGLAA